MEINVFMYLICDVTSRDHLTERASEFMGLVLCDYYVTPLLCDYSGKACDHKYCDGGDMFLVCLVNTCVKGYVNLRVEACHCESPSCHVW